MQDDVIKVARAVRLAKLMHMGHFEYYARQLVDADTATDAELRDARAAMAATLELAAEALRDEAQNWELMGGSLQANRFDRVADWLQQRAKGVTDA